MVRIGTGIFANYSSPRLLLLRLVTTSLFVHSCSAFQTHHWLYLPSKTTTTAASRETPLPIQFHKTKSNTKKQTKTMILSSASGDFHSRNHVMVINSDTTTNSDTTANGVTAPSAVFESLKRYVESITSIDSDNDGSSSSSSSPTSKPFTCRLIPALTGNLGEKHSTEEIASFYTNKVESSSSNATILEVNTLIFRPIQTATCRKQQESVYAVAIVPSSNRVDVRAFSEEVFRIQQQQKDERKARDGEHSYEDWELAPSHFVQELCGFAPGSIPPLLVPHGVQTEGAAGYPKPFATVIDSSLLPSNNNTYGNELLLLGGGGNYDYRCLVDAKFMLEKVFELGARNDNNHNVKVSSIIRFEGGMTNGLDSKEIEAIHIGHPSSTRYSSVVRKKPFFQIAPPVSSYDHSRTEQPHRPIPVTAIGRLTSVRQIAKRLVFADFAPPDYDYSVWVTNKNAPRDNKNYDKTQGGMPGPPWRSGEDGKDMYVQIIVGKTFCERYEDGTDRLKDLRAGKLVLVKGAANVDPMQKNGWRNSAGNWAQKRSLDVIVSSFEILDENDEDESIRLLVEEAQKEQNARNINFDEKQHWNSLLPWERKRDYERRAVAGTDTTVNGSDNAQERSGDDLRSSLSLSSSLPSYNNSDDISHDALTLDRFNAYFRDSPLQIQIVDGDESIRAMANGISDLFGQIKKDDGNSDFLEYVTGIDCEWRPTGAYAEALLEGPDDNPVALLQICIPAIGKVYLVDTHVILRASLAETDSMTENEGILSKTIESIFGSEEMIKVGYSVAIDFRRLAGSFPHIPAFRNVRSVVELSTLAQRLHPKSARPLLGSLQRLTKLVLGYNLAKEQQCSNWEARPMSPNQIEYAALDCALPPRLLDQMTEGTGTARMKALLPQVATAWRFQTVDSDQQDAIRLLKAKRVVGNTFVVSQNWLQSRDAPGAISLPEEGGGPYTDKTGVLKMPSNLVSIAESGDEWKNMSGKPVGKSKAKCIHLLVGNSMPEGATLDYNPRSGFIPFQDGAALFVNLPDPNGPSRRMPYPNNWLEDGRILTWFIRPREWDNGQSDTAKLLLGRGDDDSIEKETSVVLFTRIGNGDFICCGNCKVFETGGASASSKKLLELHLQLLDWEALRNTAIFLEIIQSNEQRRNNANGSSRQDPVSNRLRLAKLIVDGNVIGALGSALDDSRIKPTERSIANGVKCIKDSFVDSDDPLVLQAMEIVNGMI